MDTFEATGRLVTTPTTAGDLERLSGTVKVDTASTGSSEIPNSNILNDRSSPKNQRTSVPELRSNPDTDVATFSDLLSVKTYCS